MTDAPQPKPDFGKLVFVLIGIGAIYQLGLFLRADEMERKIPECWQMFGEKTICRAKLAQIQLDGIR